MKIGYARWAQQKDLSVQKDLLKKAGCDFIVSEKVSGGAAIEERRELFTLLDSLIEGDELVIYDLSRLSRRDSQENRDPPLANPCEGCAGYPRW